MTSKNMTSVMSGRMKGPIAIPNQLELRAAARLGFSRAYGSPFAVMNAVLTKDGVQKHSAVWAQLAQSFRSIAQTYPDYEFIFHPQSAKGAVYSLQQLQLIDKVQLIKETTQFAVYQRSADVSINTYKKRLNDARKAHKDRNVLPVVDPSTRLLGLLEKHCEAIRELGFKRAIVLYRNPAAFRKAWLVIKAKLALKGVELLCLGIRNRATIGTDKQGNPGKVTTLSSPLVFGVNGVAHYHPTGGGGDSQAPSPDLFVDSDLFYKGMVPAGAGTITYAGGMRQSYYQTLSKSHKSEFVKVDAILQLQAMFNTLGPLLSKAQLASAGQRIDGIRYFAKQYGLI